MHFPSFSLTISLTMESMELNREKYAQNVDASEREHVYLHPKSSKFNNFESWATFHCLPFLLFTLHVDILFFKPLTLSS